ncbi:MAG: redoxin domain-containing protein [Gammaproteobacteria bacterium]|nr:redoxin domain-containing protein [Gammaproteobacteria bacterium]
MKALYDIPLKTLDGTKTTLAPYQGDILLIVNVASRCGFTSQYKALEQFYRDYKELGVQVLGFPCNQFLHQESGDAKAIQQFTESCFNITFPLFEKINVKGPHQSPLYAYLAQHIQKKPWIFIPWNFTKILISRNGDVLKQFLPLTTPAQIEKSIQQLLDK